MTVKRTVALITRTLQDDGGLAVHVRRSAQALRSDGHQVITVAGSSEADVGVPSLLSGEASADDAALIAKALAPSSPDVVHLHGVDDERLVRVLVPLAVTVLSAHGWSGCGPGTRYYGRTHECPRAHGPGCVASMALRNCDHRNDPRHILPAWRGAAARLRAMHAADGVIAYSSAVEDHLRHNGIAHVLRVPLSIPAPAVPPAPAGGPPLVLFVGRLVAAKGVDVLIRAMADIDADLEILGDGWQRPSLERLARRVGRGARTTFRGWSAAADVSDAYRRAHVVVCPARWPEPFGMAGPEAMAHGRAVIASGTGGAGDWLQHGVTGLSVEPGNVRQLRDALLTLLAEPGRSAALGLNGRLAIMREYGEDRHVRALLSAYGELSRRRPRPIKAAGSGLRRRR